MKVLGLTGGIGMGKSTADQLLRQRGLPVVDTDLLARQIVEPGQPALREVQQLFGPGIVGPDGRLRRHELAQRVFKDPEARKQLEAILHPRIRALWKAQIETWRVQAPAPSTLDPRPSTLAVVVIPLLFETGAETEVDITICVACSAATQRQRLQARGWPPEQIEQRIAAQLPIAEKIARADFVVWTEAGLDVHAAQLDRILAHCSVSRL
jgi:dephospho-CoA kinase